MLFALGFAADDALLFYFESDCAYAASIDALLAGRAGRGQSDLDLRLLSGSWGNRARCIANDFKHLAAVTSLAPVL